MSKLDMNPLADSLVYEDLLSLSWEPMMDDAQAPNHVRIAEHNEHVLRCVNLLGEQVQDKIDDESEAESALSRLEAKVNLLLEMVSKLNRQKSDMPDVVRVRLAAGGIEWQSRELPPAAGSSILINLYIDNRIPESMQLASHVVTVSEDGPVATVCARFEHMGETVRDQLERMIFRYHRRMVAQSRAR